jgi:hypothetical protein
VSLPNGALSSPTYVAAFLSPDDIERVDRRLDYERGGVGLNDPSQGLLVRDWRARVVGSDVLVSGFPYITETVVTSAANIVEVSLAFDQNMRPAVAYLVGDTASLYWFDSFLAAPTTTVIGAGITSVFLTTDDKRDVATQVNSNDIILFYLRGGTQFCYRQQRDRFATEYVLDNIEDGYPYILRAGMGVGNRLLSEFGPFPAGPEGPPIVNPLVVCAVIPQAPEYGCMLDCASTFDAPAGETVFTVPHLAGQDVDMLADGSKLVRQRVANDGTVTLERSARRVLIGLPYSSRATLLTPEFNAGDGSVVGQSHRTGKLIMRFLQTIGGQVVNNEGGRQEIPFRRFGQGILDEAPIPFTGVLQVSMLGWDRGDNEIGVIQSDPYPMHLLSIVRVHTAQG